MSKPGAPVGFSASGEAEATAEAEVEAVWRSRARCKEGACGFWELVPRFLFNGAKGKPTEEPPTSTRLRCGRGSFLSWYSFLVALTGNQPDPTRKNVPGCLCNVCKGKTTEQPHILGSNPKKDTPTGSSHSPSSCFGLRVTLAGFGTRWQARRQFSFQGFGTSTQEVIIP